MKDRIQKLVLLIQNEVEVSEEIIIEKIKKFINDERNSDDDIVYFVIDSLSRR